MLALATRSCRSELYRELAARRPDVFRPNLATALFVLALRTRDVSGAAAGVPFAHEAFRTLTPEFLRYPNAQAPLIQAMLREYWQRVNLPGQQPDLELPGPLLPYFANKE